MQQTTGSIVKELVRHAAIYSFAFMLFSFDTVVGSIVSSLATRAIASRFILHVMIAVEYTVVVLQATFTVYLLVREQVHNMRRFFK